MAAVSYRLYTRRAPIAQRSEQSATNRQVVSSNLTGGPESERAPPAAGPFPLDVLGRYCGQELVGYYRKH
jgi:hypothetical protein